MSSGTIWKQTGPSWSKMSTGRDIVACLNNAKPADWDTGVFHPDDGIQCFYEDDSFYLQTGSLFACVIQSARGNTPALIRPEAEGDCTVDDRLSCRLTGTFLYRSRVVYTSTSQAPAIDGCIYGNVEDCVYVNPKMLGLWVAQDRSEARWQALVAVLPALGDRAEAPTTGTWLERGRQLGWMIRTIGKRAALRQAMRYFALDD